MVRVLRYPRMFRMVCAASMVCALLRDACISASLDGWAQVLLISTSVLLLLCIALMSCRFFVDERGVGVGFLHHVRRTTWEDIAALGLLQCNSRRQYFYGMYRGSTDFLNMLHHAPHCGTWGFVVPISKKLKQAVCMYCPFELDVSPPPAHKRTQKLRPQWHHALLYALVMIPGALVALFTGSVMLLTAARTSRSSAVLWLTLGALLLFYAGGALLYRLLSTVTICPAFNEHGVCAGLGLYLPWDTVHFGYVHRIGKISGMFLLSQPLDAVKQRGAPPIVCLSMPDTTTLLLAYLTYCPHASEGIDF